MKNVIIGAADLFDWKQIEPWCVSARYSSPNEDIILLLYRTDDIETIIQKCELLNIIIYSSPLDSWGKPIDHGAAGRHTMAWQMRFFHIWQLLKEQPQYDYVVTTDTRDVVFQTNPFDWILDYRPNSSIIGPSEHIAYEDEAWGKDNLLAGYGPYVYENLKKKTICNIGTIAGKADAIADFSLVLYSMSEKRYTPNDQSSFNVLVNSAFVNIDVVEHDLGWCCQCGTTMDPLKINKFRPHLKGEEPIIVHKTVCASDGTPFALVHQWDRVPELSFFREKYSL